MEDIGLEEEKSIEQVQDMVQDQFQDKLEEKVQEKIIVQVNGKNYEIV